MSDAPTDEQAPAAPAGWYAEGVNGQRYWDGSAWTDYRAPGAPQPAGQLPINLPTNRLAVAGFVLAVCGCLLIFLPALTALGLPAVILAVIFGAVGLARSKRVGKGRVLAGIAVFLGAAAIALILTAAILHLIVG
jgi:hypothetical protein